MRALLTIHQEGAERTIELRDAATVGRSFQAEIRIEEPTISRRHAELRFADERWWLRDLGSRNGTLRNGEPVTAIAVPLDDGDRLQFGRLQASFRLLGELPTEAPAALPPRASRLFQRMLGLTRLLCDLSTLAALAAGDAEDFSERCLARIRQAFPALARLSVLTPLRVGGGWRERVRSPAEAEPLAPEWRSALAAEAAEQPNGLLALDRASREAFAERNRLPMPREAAWAVFPMRISGELLGALYVEGATGAQGLEAADRDFWLAVTALLATAFALREPPVQTQEWRRARRVQEGFLPQGAPTVPGYRIAESHAAVGPLSRELHDFLLLADGRPAAVLARVPVEGIAGALLAARLGALLRREAAGARAPHELLTTLNRLLLRDLEPECAPAMQILALDPARGTFELAAAGHAPPFRRHGDGGGVEAIEYPPKPPLGLDATARYPGLGGQLREGDVLLLYSSGLLEGANAEGERFGAARLIGLLAGQAHAAPLIESLRRALAEFLGDSPRASDFTAIAIEREY